MDITPDHPHPHLSSQLVSYDLLDPSLLLTFHTRNAFIMLLSSDSTLQIQTRRSLWSLSMNCAVGRKQ